MATIPKVTVEVAFDGGPFSDSPTWSDVSDYVRGFQVRRGRNNELDRIEAGTLSLELDNSDGRFTPGKQKAGVNALAGLAGQVVWDLNGRADNTVMASNNVGQVEADGKPRVMSRTVYTNGKPVSCYFAVKWLDAGGGTIRFLPGTRFMADSSAAVYTHEETPPAGTVSAVLYLYADTYPEGNAGVLAYGEKAEWFRVQPYYPNVLPRRRVRVRTANLAPKDVSMGGDVSRTSAHFSTSHSPGTANTWQSDFKASGTGAVRVTMGNNGTADYASSVRCGFASGGQLFGLARVTPGTVYSARSKVRRYGTGLPTLVMLMRWYDANGATVGTSASSPAVTTTTSFQPITLAGVTAPAGAVWAGLSIGSRGGDGNMGFFVDEIQFEQGPTVSDWNPGGSIFHGYIEKWPVVSEGLTASVNVTAVDGFSVLAETDLRTAFQDQILSTGPLGYWTLGDPEGSTRLENLADDLQPARLAASKYGAGIAELGAESVVRNDPSTSYSLTGTTANQGTVVDICENGARTFPLGDHFTASFWHHPAALPAAGQTATLFRSWSETNNDHMKVQIDSAGKIIASMRFAEGSSSITSTQTASTSTPTFIVVSASAGYTFLWVNGTFQGSSDLGSVMDTRMMDLRGTSLGGAQYGAVSQSYAEGRYAHFAIWDRLLTSDEVYDLWRIADYDGQDFVENEMLRIGRIVGWAKFRGEVALDSGLSLLQGPTWNSGAKALGEIQAAASDAAGYVFMDGDGRLIYHNRNRRQGALSRFELSDTLGLPYEPGLTFEIDGDRIINEVVYKRPDGGEGVLRDKASIEAYGRKSKSLEARLDLDSDIQNAAYSLLNHYSTPPVRCDSMTLKASATPALFLVALGAEIGDRVTLADLPGQAPEDRLDYYVEAIETTVSVRGATLDWITSFSLSPASNSDVWLLDDPTLARLDRAAVLAY
ncbi:LamG-like jellyroll fold domain-containing protein [Streptomyces sp. NPDC059949]|uniref:LamG-like jellyroll fold domain-containing protein n=1 Tax=Streptomyces sp. NPDC059949 TaxID=3347013 RepID=UPI00365D54F7